MEAQSYWVTEAPLCTTPYACHERLAVPIYNRRQQGKNVLTVSSLWSGEVLLMGHSLSGHCRWDLKAKCWWTTLIALWKQILSIAKSERKAELVGKLFNNIVLTKKVTITRGKQNLWIIQLVSLAVIKDCRDVSFGKEVSHLAIRRSSETRKYSC